MMHGQKNIKVAYQFTVISVNRCCLEIYRQKKRRDYICILKHINMTTHRSHYL